MKAIIIGASLSGKTTIIKQLRGVIDCPISEMDEELTEMNGGKYPSDNIYKNDVLTPKVIEEILRKNDIIFFTNTDYFNPEDLQKAKSIGFKIIQIEVSQEKLLKRNIARVKNESYRDLSQWLKGMMEYQKDIRQKGLIDGVIDGNQPTAQIVKQLENLFITTQDR